VNEHITKQRAGAKDRDVYNNILIKKQCSGAVRGATGAMALPPLWSCSKKLVFTIFNLYFRFYELNEKVIKFNMCVKVCVLLHDENVSVHVL